MRYPKRRPSRPFDAWNPYGSDPGPRNRFAPGRLLRVAIPLSIGIATIGHDLWRLLVPDHSAATTQTTPANPPERFMLRQDRFIPPDPRTELPRKAKPAENPGAWFTTDDYPDTAARDEMQGQVSFRFTIAPNGLVHACRVVKSSGSVVLDGAACNVYTFHARYWPARDKTGRAISDTGQETVRWQMPKD